MTHAITVNFRLEEADKNSLEQIRDELGISMSTALTMFAKKVIREKRIPFEVYIDPFYSESNMKHLEKIMSNIQKGNAHFASHELIEEEN